MPTERGLETRLDELVQRFETGAIDRRTFVKAAAALGALAYARPASAAPLDPDDAGRQVALERILNHAYAFTDPNYIPGTNQPTDSRVKLVGAGAYGKVDSTTGSGVNPIVVTSPGHRLRDYDRIYLTGVKGNVDANGDRVARNCTATTFDLYEPDGTTPVAGSGDWEPCSASWREVPKKGAIGSATYAVPRVTINTAEPHRLRDGDMVIIRGVADGVDGRWAVTNIGPGAQPTSFELDHNFPSAPTLSTGPYKYWSQTFEMFDGAPMHRDWLFGEDFDGTADPAWESGGNGRGFAQYAAGGPAAQFATTADAQQRHAGAQISQGNARMAFERTKDNSKRRYPAGPVGNSDGIDLFDRRPQTGKHNYNYYDFDDLYGLVRLKLEFTGDHVATHTITTMLYAMNALAPIANVPVNGGTGTATVKLEDVLQAALWAGGTPNTEAQLWNDLRTRLESSHHAIRPIWKDIHDEYYNPKSSGPISFHGGY